MVCFCGGGGVCMEGGGCWAGPGAQPADTYCIYNYKSEQEGKDQKSIQSSPTPDPGYECESDNFTIRHHKREISPFPAGDTRHQ